MDSHGAAELVRFLKAVDSRLTAPTRLLVIGGAAAALHYGATRGTSDIDTFASIPDEILEPARLAREETGLDIPVAFATVADAPYDYQDRLEVVPLMLV